MKLELYKQALEASVYDDFAECFNRGCNRCTLSRHRENYPVLYRGNLSAKIMLFGEAPGRKETQTGKPFVGPAGELLDKIFSLIGINTNKEMILTNICYCQPIAPRGSGRQNYTPKKNQILKCWPFGEKAIKLVNPSILIACGKPALETLTGENQIRIGQWEGKWLKRPADNRNLFVMRHPASILHQAHFPETQRETKNKVWKYMKYFRDSYKEKL